jgi:hypothetical protein
MQFSLPWLAAMLCLAGFSFFLVLALRRLYGKRRAPRLVFAAAGVFLGGAIALALAGGISTTFFSPLTALLLGGMLALSLLLQIFRRPVGTLLILAIVGVVLFAVLFLRSLAAFTGRTKLADIAVVSASTNAMILQLYPATVTGPETSEILELQGTRFGVVVYQVIFDDLAVFFGSKTRYAWLGMMAFDSELRQTDLRLFPDAFNRKAVFEQIERGELALPFVKSVQMDIATRLADPGKHFAVWVENDGGITIEAEKRRLTQP